MSYGLELCELKLKFGTKWILADINIALPQRGICVVMGPGGSGKSTLLRLLAGTWLDSSSAEISGTVLRNEEPFGAQNTGMLVQQKLELANSTVFDNIVNALPNRSELGRQEQRQLIVDTLTELGLPWLVDELDTSIIEVSLFVRRATALTAALLKNPEMLLLDEITAALKDHEADALLNIIRKEGLKRLVIFVTHHQGHAKAVADYAALLAAGQLVEWNVADAFFHNPASEHTQQYLRTGGCSLPSINATDADLDPDYLDIDEPVPAPVAPLEVNTPREPHENNASAPHKQPHEHASLQTHEPQEHIVPATPQPQLVATIQLVKSPQNPRTARRFEPSRMGPRGFHWVLPGALAGTPRPGIVVSVDYDLEALKRVGITDLITLTEEDFPQSNRLHEFDIEGTHFPVPDMKAPSCEDARIICAGVSAWLKEGRSIAYHCKAGLGRTGTMLAAQLIFDGEKSDEALKRVREIEPRWVQSKTQEDFLKQFQEFLAP